MQIYVLHENPEWLPPLAAALDARKLPWAEWFLDEGTVDFAAEPPEGIFYSRMSASSHTRDHRHSPDLALAVLAWLERHGRRVLNGSRVLDLEISKVRQYAALEKAGIPVPRTVAVVGAARLPEVAERHFGGGPFILKPNRGGKGLGVQLFQSAQALAQYVAGPDYEAPVDGVHLLQDYIKPVEPMITRAEFVGGRFVYAVEVDTTGGFELCPADACAIDDAFCPVGSDPRPKFKVAERVDADLIARYEAFLSASGIDVAGIEFVRNADGVAYTYDINTNTNYNSDAEKRAGVSGMGALATYLASELNRLYPANRAAE